MVRTIGGRDIKSGKIDVVVSKTVEEVFETGGGMRGMVSTARGIEDFVVSFSGSIMVGMDVDRLLSVWGMVSCLVSKTSW